MNRIENLTYRIKRALVIYYIFMKISETDVLSYLQLHVNMTYSEALDNIIMTKRQYYLGMHKYSISQGKDGGWFTHFLLPTGKRIMVRAADRTGIEDKIIEHYKGQSEAPCFPEVFRQWQEERLQFGEISPSTYTRYLGHYNRFFPASCPFCNVRLVNMTDSILRRFIKQSIRDHHLTRKTYSGLETLLIGVLKYAKENDLTDYSVSAFFSDLDLPDRMFAHKVAIKDEEEVFNEEEALLLIDYLKDIGDIISLGLVLMFQTCIRVGELVALKHEDVSLDRLSINATEVNYLNTETGKRVFGIQDMPKTECGERYVLLPKQAAETLKAIHRLNPSGSYLFMRNGKQIHSKSFNYYLKKACTAVGIPKRSTHKIRKTYASTLINGNVNEKLIQRQLGHKDIETTKKYYYFNTNTKESDRNIISSVIRY